VLLVTLGVCFLLACFIAWMILFTTERDVVLRQVEAMVGKCVQRIHGVLRSKGRAVVLSGLLLQGAWLGLSRSFQRHSLLWAGGLFFILLPPFFALLLSDKSMLQGFDDSSRHANIQVSELLRGELLVPPPPLPPDFFTSQEVTLVRPMLVSASRNWQLLNSEYTQRLLLVFKIMKEKYDYDMTILEGYRSPERQNMLAALGPNVTNVAAFQSYHQFGLAADCAFMRYGKLVISEKDPWAMQGYRLYGEVAESVGLTWGGRWKMMDFGHTELHLPGVLKKP
jgi:peptidoglycan L-alanyl-D-glutamate endopeptidase CwlK